MTVINNSRFTLNGTFKPKVKVYFSELSWQSTNFTKNITKSLIVYLQQLQQQVYQAIIVEIKFMFAWLIIDCRTVNWVLGKLLRNNRTR